jgi:hypothetical protein
MNARGLLYPASIGERFVGSWVNAGTAIDGTVSNYLRPNFAPNYTVEFGVTAPHPQHAVFGFGHSGGDAQFVFSSKVPYENLPTLQDITAAVEMFDGAGLASERRTGVSKTQKLAVIAHGVYAADAGLIFMVGSGLGGSVNVVPRTPSLAPSSSPNASPSSLSSSSSFVPVLSTSSSPAPRRAAPRRAQPNSSTVPSDRCDILFALRVKPIGFESISNVRRLSIHTATEELNDKSILERDFISTLIPEPFKMLYLNSKRNGYEQEINANKFVKQDDIDLQKDLKSLSAIVFNTQKNDNENDSLYNLLKTLKTTLNKTDGFLNQEENIRRRLGTVKPEELFHSAYFIPMYGHAISINCDFSFNISVIRESFATVLEDKATDYALIATLTGIAMIVVTVLQVVASSSQTGAFKVSIVTIGIQALMDTWLSFSYTVIGIVKESMFSSFATAAFLHLILFTMLEMQFMLMILKARRPDVFAEGWNGVRRQVATLYFAISACIFISFLAMYSGSQSSLQILLFCCFSMWVPQIIHSAHNDSRHGLKPSYILTASVSRLFPLLYVACPYNVLFALFPDDQIRVEALGHPGGMENAGDYFSYPLPSQVQLLPSSSTPPAFANPRLAAVYWKWFRFIVFLTFWIIAQVVVLFLQEKASWGPRFFVPYVFLPEKYNYHRIIEVRDGRIVPDPRHTSQWLAHVRPSVPEPAERQTTIQGEGGSIPEVRPPETEIARVQAIARQSFRQALQTVRSIHSSSVFFMNGMAQLADDCSTYLRRRFRTRTLSTQSRRPDNHNPVQTSGDEVSSRGGASSAWLSFMSPRSRGRRYAHLEEEPEVEVSSQTSTGDDSRDKSSESRSLNGTSTALESSIGIEAHPRDGASIAATNQSSNIVGNAPIDEENPDLDDIVGTSDFGSIDCVICQDAIVFPIRSSVYMITPCDHLFHTTCLRPWLDHALQCPTCRLMLPPP